MKMRSRVLAVLLLAISLPSLAFAQGSAVAFPAVLNPMGQGIPSAQIHFCAPGAIVTNGVCSPTVTVYKDQGLTIPWGSAILTDGLGEFPQIWFAPGNYCYSLSGFPIAPNLICHPFTAPAPLVNGVFCLGGDTGLSRNSPAFWDMGNCTPGDSSGSLKLTTLFDSNIFSAAGSAANPSSAFQTDGTTGSYLAGVATYGIAAGGVVDATFSTTAVTVSQPLTGTTTINATTGFQVAGAAATNAALIGNGTNFVSTALSLASAQFANQGTTTTVLHGNAAGNPSWAGISLANDTAANQGTTTTVLHGNGAGQPSFGAVVSGDMNITTTSCTNQFITAISSGGVGTCTTDTLASAQHANQGTTTTVLHGNGAGNPSFGAVSLTADVSGILPTANGGTGQNSTATFPSSGVVVAEAATETLTNKRITPRVQTAADATSITPTSDTADITVQTNTQVGGTLTINAPSGTPTDGQKLIIRPFCTNSQTYSFNAAYAFSATVVAPTTCAAGKTDYLGTIWDARSSKWDVVAVDQGH